MKQTAVEWLFEQLCSEKLSWNKDSMGKLFIDLKTSHILQQAKEMEKEQMDKISEDWWNEGASYMHDIKREFESFEQYYNETFKK
jgi:hypothetical protein